MAKISGVIITFNEEKCIGRCIESIKDVVDEIVVVDSFSTDETRKICLQYGARVVERVFTGFTDQKNFADDYATYDYVLSLDADEALSEELKAEILKVKNHLSYDGYFFNRLNNHCGQWIRYSNWYPDVKIRLYNRRKSRWYSPSNLHETVQLDDPYSKQKLEGDLLHWAYDSYSEHYLKIDNYTSLAATNYIKAGEKSIGIIKIVINPFWKFFKNYFIKKGFLDGFEGFVICAFAGISTFLKYIKIRELQKIQNENRI
jgi:glycosyltransferase involved in cell wall biosynthesis